MYSKPRTRRQFIQGAALSCASIAAFGLFGCGDPSNTGSSGSSANAEADNASGAASNDSSASSTTSGSTGNQLVLVFSRAGENYGVGTVDVGNTMVVAQMIQEATGADLFEIEPVNPYPQDYDETTAIAQTEKNEGARPELKALPNLSGYDVVYLGFPTWWSDAPMPVYTAIESLDWNGITIAPFNTHAGSQDAGMFQKLKSLCEGANVLEGLSIAGTMAQNDKTETEQEVDEWLASLPIA